MSFFVTRFQQGQFKDGTFTDQANLAEAMLLKPEIIESVIVAFNSGRNESYGVMQQLTQGLGALGEAGKNYKVLGNDEIMWPVQGHLMRTMPIAQTVTTDVNARIGIGFSEFTVLFPEKYFSLGFVCRFIDGTIARVTQEPYRDGSNWCYTYQIIDNNPNAFVATDALAVGREVSWDFTAYEEGSEGGGMVEATPSWFKNQLTTCRMAQSMTGSAKLSKLWFEVANIKTGKKSRFWLYHKQAEFMRQWARQHERMIWNGKYNRLPDGTFANYGANGRPVKTGSGIEQQISGVNKIVASELTEEMLYHMAADLTHLAGDAENQKRVLITGMGGMYEFDKALKNAGKQYTIVDTNFVHKQTGVKLAFGGNYTTYKGPYGFELTVINHPMFNDTTVYPNLINGYTDQSYKMFFMDFSDYNGEPNFQMVTRGAEGEDRRLVQWFTAGGSTPDFSSFSGSSGINKVMRSHGADSFTCYTLSESQLIIRNPLACGMIQITPNVV